MSTIKYTESHEWLRLEADGSAIVGITDFAQQQLGDIVYVALPETGASFGQDEEAATVESVKAAGEIKLPVAGTVLAVNEALNDAPNLVNEAPEGDGWFLRIQVESPEQLDGLMDEAAYQAYTRA
jgi:glycine cleavage system H protein